MQIFYLEAVDMSSETRHGAGGLSQTVSGSELGPYGAQQPAAYGAQQPSPYGQRAPQGGGYGPAGSPYGAGAGGRSFSVIGPLTVAVGAVLILVSFTVLNWFSTNSGSNLGANGKSTFGKVHDATDKIVGKGQGLIHAAPVADLYFSWLGWVLLIAAVGAAFAAQRHSLSSNAFRRIGLAVGLAGAGLTLGAIKLLSADDAKLNALVTSGDITSSDRAKLHKVGTYAFYFDHSAIGHWFAVTGFLALGVGAALGARRRT